MLPNRPKNLNLFTIHFPIPAIVSILHRITGFVLFLLIPFALWGLSYSLSSDGFARMQYWFSNPFVKLFFWAVLVPFIFHFVAGVRHLLSDIHIGDTLKGGRLASYLTFIVSAVLIILAGVWLW